MTDFAAKAQQFWDAAHSRSAPNLVADHGLFKFVEMYRRAGLFDLFDNDLFRAKAVLDIGPGYARVLRDDWCQDKKKYAVEISPVNRERLRGWGIEPLEPGELPPAVAGTIDLAWSTSCFNHCDPAMLDVLVRQVAQALREGGYAYLENVYALPGAQAPDPVAGPFGVEAARFVDLCWSHDLRLVNFTDLPIYDAPEGSVPWGRYIVRVRKEG